MTTVHPRHRRLAQVGATLLATAALTVVGAASAQASTAADPTLTYTWDLDGDGSADQWGIDRNADGYTDLWVTDMAHDGVLDEVATDTDGDTWPDTWLYDTNQDRLVDAVAHDGNRDGLPDPAIALTAPPSSSLPPGQIPINTPMYGPDAAYWANLVNGIGQTNAGQVIADSITIAGGGSTAD